MRRPPLTANVAKAMEAMLPVVESEVTRTVAEITAERKRANTLGAEPDTEKLAQALEQHKQAKVFAEWTAKTVRWYRAKHAKDETVELKLVGNDE